MQAWWALFLVPLVLRGLGARRSAARGHIWLDLLIGLGLGAVLAWVKLHGVATTIYGGSFPWFMSDAIKICSTMEHLQTGATEGILRHPGGLIFAAAAAGKVGLAQGLFTSAMGSSALHTGLLYVLGVMLHSRMAGLVAALFSCAVAPLALMPVHLTHYPAATAVYLLATTLGVAALLTRGRMGPLLAGLGAGLALFVDFGGLAIAIPIVVVGLVRWAKGGRSNLVAGGLGLALPIAASWGIAHAVVPPETSRFEVEVHGLLRESRASVPDWMESGMVRKGIPSTTAAWRPPTWVLAALPDPGRTDGAYLWGHSTPPEMVRSLFRVAQLTRGSVPPDLPPSWSGEDLQTERAQDVEPWLPLYGVAIVLMVLGLRRRPILLLWLLFLFLPYASALGFQVRVRVWLRFLMMPLTPLPLVFGLAWASLALGSPTAHLSRWRWLPGLRSAVVVVATVGFLALAIEGRIPTHISVDAGWRSDHQSRPGDFRDLMKWLEDRKPARPGTAIDGGAAVCMGALEADQAAGRGGLEWTTVQTMGWEWANRGVAPDTGGKPRL